MVGLDARSTMDIDATVQGATVGIEAVENMIASIISVDVYKRQAEGFVGMEIRGDRLTDKENAGAALLDTCKEVKGKDPVQILSLIHI